MRLLVVEDEEALARHLIRGLREEGHEVDHAASLAAAAELAAAADYDLALLDLKLPDGSGLDLLRRWREENRHFPVLVLTARDTVGDRVEGLDSGAHDYLTKPFSFDELLARVRSLLRRRAEPSARRQVFAELSIDRDALSAEVGGKPLRLTARELALLEYFLQHPRRVLSRRAIAEQVWDASWDADSNVIDVLVGRLRRKIKEAGGRALLHAVKGLGYVLREPDED
jgi:DNA-binding response OmpR family regulator